MTDSYSYDREFRLKIIALLLNNVWVIRYGAIILPDYFETETEVRVVQALHDYVDSYGVPPRDATDVVALCGIDCADTVYDIFEAASDDLKLASDVAIQFAREQAAKIAVLESVDYIKRGSLDKIIPRFQEVMKVGVNLEAPGIDFIRDRENWLHHVAVGEKHSTGWWHIDRLLDGGLGVGELGVVLSPSNVGKTMSLINIGYGAASIMGGGLNVVHFSHEIKSTIVAKRYAARTMFRFPRRGDDIQEYGDELYEIAKKLLPGKIRIIDGAMSVYDMDAKLEMLSAEGFKPDIIIDDYADLMTPPRRYTEKRHELTDIYLYLRDVISTKYNAPVWTASQSNRASYNKEIITSDDIAEDIGKVNSSDVIVALCQTRKEYEASRCRLFMAKVRDGRRGDLFHAKYYPDSQAIITLDKNKWRTVDV